MDLKYCHPLMDPSVDSESLDDGEERASFGSDRVVGDLFRRVFSAFLLVSLNDDEGDEGAGPFEVISCPLSLAFLLSGRADGPTGSCGPTAATTVLPSTGPIAARLGGWGPDLGPEALFLLFGVPPSTITPSLRHCVSYCRNMSMKSGIGAASGLRR